MCGIAGFVDASVTHGDKVLAAMLEKIAHRGPDARKTYVSYAVYLGHNRLSIIDLSHEADQPMHFKHYTIVFNGEIYNYLELKAELIKAGAQFKTQSDTEVVLQAFHHWGKECVHRFVGMWAFAIWDNQQQQLFCSRDRFGIKPFYYIHQSKSLYFGSEYKALRPTPVFSNHINVNQVSRGLQMGWTSYHDETYFSCLKALPAASCLSGGLDSSAIVSMVQHQQPGLPYQTFSIYYQGKDEVDERPFVKEVLQKFPSLIPHYYSPTEDEVTQYFHHAMYHADVPATGSSFISQYFLMKLIAQHGIKVVLDGQGADEYLAGYNHTAYRMVADLLHQFKIGSAISLTHAIAQNQQLSLAKRSAHWGKSVLSLMRNEQQLYALEYSRYFPFLSKEISIPFMLNTVPGNRTDNFLYHLIFETSLPTLLQYEDRNSMAFSIESRVPFLDHRLVEFSFQLQNDDKLNGIYTKWIMRQALKNILPEKIATRKDKKGFVTPGEQKWLRGPLQHLVQADFGQLDFLDQKKINSLIADYQSGNNRYALLVWRLCTLAYWQKHFC